MKVQRLAVDLANDIAELDINPLLARPDGVIALDALVVARGPRS
jgi:succinyl-CoA synthetase beta subunit